MFITFPDGNKREFKDGSTGLEIAAEISTRLAKATLSCDIDGAHSDAFRPITGDHAIKFYTFADENGRWAYRHTASHVLAQAVKRLYPEVKLAIGPAIENGFYFDFDAPARSRRKTSFKIEPNGRASKKKTSRSSASNCRARKRSSSWRKRATVQGGAHPRLPEDA
jgi:threonyl-tRNA synthetase